MMLQVDGLDTHVVTGGVEPSSEDPVVVFVHGAGMDGTVWQLQTRYMAYRSFRAIAVDLPGHGRSAGAPLDDVSEMAAWLTRFLEALDWGPVLLVGHSMGTFIAMETAAARPDLVSGLVLLGTATAMPVHPELLRLATDDVAAAAALMAGWSHDTPARTGLNPTPGLWMTGGQRALIERSADGALAIDLAACAAYERVPAIAPTVDVPTTIVIGRGDRMTPAKGGRAVAGMISGAEVVEIDSGHSMMLEAPRAVRAAILSRARA